MVSLTALDTIRRSSRKVTNARRNEPFDNGLLADIVIPCRALKYAVGTVRAGPVTLRLAEMARKLWLPC
jgi:hypothetical protein